MNQNEERITIAYIGGGSRGWGWRFMPALADESLCAMVKLYDADKDCALTNEVIGNNIHDNGKCRGDIVYLACDTPEEALREADFVIVSFEPGDLEELVTELHLPESFGIVQTSGENSGVAGVIRALKIMPECARYARLIKELCPEAWVINMSTPMAACMSVMNHIFPEIKLMGADNSTYDCRELIAAMLCEAKEISGVRRRDIKTNLIGISGFSWFDEISAGGENLIGMFREFAERYGDSGYEFRVNEFKTNPDADAHKVKFDLFLRYGLIPAVNDRTAAEFCPPWYTVSPKNMAAWKFSPMTAGYRKKMLSDKAARVKKYMLGEPLGRSLAPTEVPQIIRALTGGGNFIASVDLPNAGQVKNLPEGTIVCTNALVSADGVRPVSAGALPGDILGLTLRHVYNRDALVRAYLDRDLDVAFNAFLGDPVNICSMSDSAELYKQMLAAVRNHLLYYCEE